MNIGKVKWVVMTKQPLSSPCDRYFRSLVRVLNSYSSTKVKDLGEDMIRQKLFIKLRNAEKLL